MPGWARPGVSVRAIIPALCGCFFLGACLPRARAGPGTQANLHGCQNWAVHLITRRRLDRPEWNFLPSPYHGRSQVS
jgi:hypothetical protein